MSEGTGSRGLHRTPVVAITGPTACGKSALAVALAQAFDGVVINADSMQLYRELPILTAQPCEEDMARVPHRLYGVRSAADPCSAEAWRAMAATEIDAARDAGKLPILVGGTGLYLRALLRGLASVPTIPEAVRARVRAVQAEVPAQALHAELARRDPLMAARLNPRDSQRVARALEVVEATGRSLAEYQEEQGAGGGGMPYDLFAVVSLPARQPLYRRIEARLDEMIAAGALGEIEVLLKQALDPRLPAMKAVGVPELAAHVHGEIPLEAALAGAKQATRRYAKRQLTWLRHQTARDVAKGFFFYAQFSKRFEPLIFNEIRGFMLTAQP